MADTVGKAFTISPREASTTGPPSCAGRWATWRASCAASPAWPGSRPNAPCGSRCGSRRRRSGLFPGGEVAALGQLVPVDDVAHPPFGPAPRGPEDLLREDADPDRQVELGRGEAAEALPVEPRRRGAGAGQPVEHDVVEHLVAASARPRAGRCCRSRPRTSRRSRRPGRPASRPGRSRASAAACPAAWSSRSPCPGSRLHRGQRGLLGRRSAARFRSSASGNTSGMLRWIAAQAGGRSTPIASSRPRPSRRPGRPSARSRAAPSARSRRRRCAARPSRFRSACRRTRSRAATGRRRGRRRSAAPPCAVGSVSGLDHLQELDHRARPAVGDDQRQRVRVRRADVQEVDAEAVDRGLELAERFSRASQRRQS